MVEGEPGSEVPTPRQRLLGHCPVAALSPPPSHTPADLSAQAGIPHAVVTAAKGYELAASIAYFGLHSIERADVDS